MPGSLHFLAEQFPDQFVTADDQLSNYGASLTGTVVKPAAIFYPCSTEDVIRIIQLATKNQFTIFPISRGKNFGYSEAQGTVSDQVIVDMSRLNKVITVDSKLAYATLQPGVSQQQLSLYLKEHKIPLQLDVTGAGFDASVVGNILERGFGHTDYGDRWARVIRLQVVTGKGELINTGGGIFHDSTSSYRYGIGPMMDGLFSQSNFGVITEMTIELMPKPKRMLMFVVSTQEEKNLEGIVSAIRELKLAGVLNSAVHIANKARAVGEKENKLAGVWNLSGNISGDDEIISAKKSVIRKTFNNVLNGSSEGVPS